MSNEERLEREIPGSPKAEITAADLAKSNCQDVQAGLGKARNEARPETERLGSYSELFVSLKKRAESFEEAFARNPDLAYQEGSQQLVEARELCVSQLADVKVEFDRFVRDLVKVPTVQEPHGGSLVTVARIDFTVLKQAIDVLAADDKDQLLARVVAAEKSVSTHEEKGRKR